MIRVLICDDHMIVRQGIRQSLAEAPDIEVATEAGDGPGALQRLRHGGIDVLLLDIALPGRDGLDVLRQTGDEHPKLPVLMLSTYPDRQYAVRSLKLGARGYLNKSADSEQISAAVRLVARGERFISPLAWMPLALYTIKDSAASGIFVIFICSLWPMLINTAFGVAGVRREWLNVARTLEVSPLRKAFEVILPAAAPTILTGMRISMGIAWLVIVAAEMLVGGTGIGYFVWNEWNNLSLPNVIFAILVIGVVGMLLDLMFAKLQRAVTYVD